MLIIMGMMHKILKFQNRFCKLKDVHFRYQEDIDSFFLHNDFFTVT